MYTFGVLSTQQQRILIRVTILSWVLPGLQYVLEASIPVLQYYSVPQNHIFVLPPYSRPDWVLTLKTPSKESIRRKKKPLDLDCLKLEKRESLPRSVVEFPHPENLNLG